MGPAAPASVNAAGADWQLVRTAAERLQSWRCANFDTDTHAVRLAAECLHTPKRLCCALALPAAAPTSNAAPGSAEPAAASWQERAVIVTLLVQQLMELLLSGSQAGAEVLGLSSRGITPPRDVVDAAIAARVIELLATHAELTAAVAAFTGGEATAAAQPLAVSAAVQLLHFATAQLQAPLLAHAESRRSSRSLRRSGAGLSISSSSSSSQPEQQPLGYIIPLELAAYAVTLAQTAVAVSTDADGQSSATQQLAVAAWRMYTAAGTATGTAAAGTSNVAVTLHEALQRMLDGTSQAHDTAAAASTAESARASEVAQSPPTPTLTPSRPARASSGSSGPSAPAQRPPPRLPPETPLQTAVMRPLKPLSSPPSRRIRPQQITKPKPVEAWANLQAAEQQAREQWNNFLACKEELISTILQEGKPEEYSAASSGSADASSSDDEAQPDEVSSPPCGGRQGSDATAPAPQPASAPQGAQARMELAVHDPDAAVRAQLLCMSLWLFTTCLKAQHIDTAAVLEQLLPVDVRCAAADRSLLAIDSARGVDRFRRVKEGAAVSPCGVGAVVMAHHLLDSMKASAQSAAAAQPAAPDGTAALGAILLASRVQLLQLLLRSAQPEEAQMPSAKTWPPRLLAAQLLQAALAVAPLAIVNKVRSSALGAWLQMALQPQIESRALSRDDRNHASLTAVALLHTVADDLGPLAKVTRWAEHLMPAPPVGFATGAPLPTRRAALQQLLELVMAAAASLAPQAQGEQAGPPSSTPGSDVPPGQLDATVSGPVANDAAALHTGGVIGLPLSDVAAALLRRLYAEMQAEGGQETLLTGGARQQALMVQLAHEVLAHSTAAAQRLAAQLSGTSAVDWNLAVQCMNGQQLWALLASAPLKGVLDAVGVRQSARRQQPSLGACIRARRDAFAAAQAALEAALEGFVAREQAPRKQQRCRVLDPADVLRSLRLPAALPPAQPQVHERPKPDADLETSGRESLGSDSASLRKQRSSSGCSTGKRKRRPPIANNFIASIAETEGGTRVDYDSEAAIDVEDDDTGRYLAPHETAWLLPMKEFIVCKKGRTKDDYKTIVQAVNKRATVKPRLMTGSTWQPAFANGEAECSDDDSIYSEADDEDEEEEA